MGQYRLSANVAHVEANDLRRTLGVRPPPLPIGGALRGIMHCTGPLEQPVFSGALTPPCLPVRGFLSACLLQVGRQDALLPALRR